jgi:integrase
MNLRDKRDKATGQGCPVGKAAGVVVKQREKLDDKGKPVTVNQCASAHDLRRSFGFRWSRRVMPTILRELMRHESIETTMRYYVGQNAESTADELWRVAGSASTAEPLQPVKV